MSSKLNQGRHMRLALGTVLVLTAAACGGGGSKKEPEPAPQSKISLGGVVSKGRTSNALVRVYGVTGSGAVDTGNVLATGQTDGSGNYSTSQFTPPSTYVVEVAARDCANTTSGSGCSSHLDEKTGGNQYLPTGFKMRAVVTTTPSNKRVNITPFSEMAVAAAQAAGGLSVDNANKGIAMANGLVGVVDLNAVDPTALSDTNATPDQQRLAALLAAVSSVAGTGSSLNNVGCGSLTAGTPDATKCVVEKLAANSTVINYVGSNAAVSGALNTELEAVVANSTELKALVEPTTKKLTDPTITVAVVAPAGQSAIDKVKAFVNDMLSTFTTLLSGGNTNKDVASTGAALDQARQFGDAVAGANFQAFSAQHAIQIMHAAAKVWTDYETDNNSPVAIYGHSSDDKFEWDFGIGFRCALKDSGDADILGPGGTVHHVTCQGDQLLLETGGATGDGAGGWNQPAQRFYHRYVITRPGADQTQYDVTASARRDDVTIHYSNMGARDYLTTNASGALVQTSPVTSFGAIATTLGANNVIEGMVIDVKTPDGFAPDGSLRHGAASNAAFLRVQSTVTGTDVNGSNPHLAFTATTTSYAGDGLTVDASTSFGTGSFMTATNDELSAFKLIVSMNVPAHASYPESNLVGTLEGTRTISGGANAQEYGSVKFNGQAYRGPGNTTTPFISGTVEFVVNDTNYNKAVAYSDANYQSGNIFIDAFVTAPSHPKLRAIVGMSARKTAHDYQLGNDSYGTISANFIAYNADGSARRDAYITITPATNPPNGDTKSVFGDATNKIQLSTTDGVTESDVLVDGTKVGVYDKDSGRITFTDGSYIVPDFGFVVY